MKIKLRKYRTAIFSALAVMASAAMIHYAMGQRLALIHISKPTRPY